MCEVLVSGCFGMLHPDHIRLLEFAAQYGKVTVGINSTPYVVKRYGGRAFTLLDRVYALRSIRYVEEVLVFSQETPAELIRDLRPKYYVKGPDYKDVELPEQAALDEVGCRLIIRSGNRQYSSSDLLAVPRKTKVIDF